MWEASIVLGFNYLILLYIVAAKSYDADQGIKCWESWSRFRQRINKHLPTAVLIGPLSMIYFQPKLGITSNVMMALQLALFVLTLLIVVLMSPQSTALQSTVSARLFQTSQNFLNCQIIAIIILVLIRSIYHY